MKFLLAQGCQILLNSIWIKWQSKKGTLYLTLLHSIIGCGVPSMGHTSFASSPCPVTTVTPSSVMNGGPLEIDLFASTFQSDIKNRIDKTANIIKDCFDVGLLHCCGSFHCPNLTDTALSCYDWTPWATGMEHLALRLILTPHSLLLLTSQSSLDL